MSDLNKLFQKALSATHKRGANRRVFGSQLPAFDHIKELIARKAQKVYDDWDENVEEYANGGICHLIADETVGVLDKQGFEATSVSAQTGEVHVFAVFKTEDGVFEADINPYVYERGGGYNWKKLKGVKFSKDDVTITKLSGDPDEFESYIDG